MPYTAIPLTVTGDELVAYEHPIMKKVFSGDLSFVEKLLSNNFDVNYKFKSRPSYEHRTMLMLAVTNKGTANDAVTDYLLQHPDLHIDDGDIEGRTALIYAALNGNLNAVEALIRYGASTDAKDGKYSFIYIMNSLPYFTSREEVEQFIEKCKARAITDPPIKRATGSKPVLSMEGDLSESKKSTTKNIKGDSILIAKTKSPSSSDTAHPFKKLFYGFFPNWQSSQPKQSTESQQLLLETSSFKKEA